jgi:hypothetical protein
LGKYNLFLQITGYGTLPPSVVEFLGMDGDYVDRVLDLWPLPEFLESIDKAVSSRRPLPYSNFLARWSHVIPTILLWMIVAHNLDSKNVDKVITEYFTNIVCFESDYILAKGEAIYFLKTSLIETNGVKIYILEAGSLVGHL